MRWLQPFRWRDRAPRRAAGGHALAPPRRTMRRARRIGMPLLFACLISTGMGQSLFFALFPPIARDLGLTEIQVSAIFTLSAILWIFLSPFWGRQSDIWGRKPIIVIGLVGFGVSTGGFALLLVWGLQPDAPVVLVYGLMILVRAIFGALGSGTPPSAQAYIADHTSSAERTRGVAAINAAFGMGVILGPGFAAALVWLHLLAPFFALATFAMLSAFLVAISLPERRHRAGERRRVRQSRDAQVAVSDARLRPFLLIGTGMSLSQAAVFQVAAFFVMDVMQHDGAFTAQLVGVAMMSMAMTTLFAQLVLIPLLQPAPGQLMRWGAGLSLGAFALLLLPASEGLFVFAISLEGLGAGLLRPGIAAGMSLAVRAREQGAAAGWLNSTAAIGITLVPIIIMPLYGVMARAPFMIGFLLMALVFASSFLPRFVRLAKPLAKAEEGVSSAH